MTPPITVALALGHPVGHPVRLDTHPYPREQAEAMAVKLQALWTDEELRANARLIEAYLERSKP